MAKSAIRGRLRAGVCLIVLVLLSGCGGNSAKREPTRGGWLGSTGSDALLIPGDSTYQLYSLNGYWESGSLTMSQGNYTFTVAAALNGTGVGTSRSGTYTVSDNALHLVPSSGSLTDWSRMPDGGPVPSELIGSWMGNGQYLTFYASGYFYYYDSTTLSLGRCVMSGGNFTLHYEGSDDSTLIGTTMTGTYSVTGDTCTWTPQGRSPMDLARQP
jgi:hypothetical protein